MTAWTERSENFLHALTRRREDDARMRWSRDALLTYQRARLRELVTHASTASPFYRELYGGVIDRDVELHELPVVTKDAMMASFDRVVTDPRLRIAELRSHVETLRDDELYLDQFRVMTTSGSSGAKAIVVYDRRAWRDGMLPASLRMSRSIGLAPDQLPRPRLLTIAAGDGKHMTFRSGASMDVGGFYARRLSAALPLSELVAEVQQSRPTHVVGYPSILAELADEQRAGRLQIAPRSIATTSEVRTEAMTEAIRSAWHVEPYDCLGLTETGIVAVDCAEHAGLHVFEDLSIVEAVDDDNRAVPPNTVGAKLLVTNLTNFVQPIIRYEVSDLVNIDPNPCACGITLQRIVSLDGRSDDILELPGSLGRVRVHPIQLRSVLGKDPAVLEYQITHRGSRVEVDVVLAHAVDVAAVTSRLAHTLEASLKNQGAEVAIAVRAVPAITRETGSGKLQLVRSIVS